ncbi:MAG: hypothetical protein EOO99_11470 [Pedobacter sp.]|nr:MAG: hypothetical protein EOO99_11470 [Pedobacter sp.]
MQNTAIFPLFYLPNVSYFTNLKAHDYIFILEKQEYFPKQTYRNRALILSPNGPLTLTIPVIKGSKVHTLYKDVKISYNQKWQRLHKLSLQNCYRSSAYFEYYEDELIPFYEKKQTYLFDYNLRWFEFILKQLKLKLDLKFTDEYNPQTALDFRTSLSKLSLEVPSNSTFTNYFQVFNDRMPFQKNLCILDLLFNQGPQAKNYF